MLSHIASVAMGRWFAQNRGTAVAISSLGFSIAEATLPIIFVAIMALIGWRGGWTGAALAGILLIPVLWVLLQTERSPKSVANVDHTAGMEGRNWSRGQAVRHWLFWATLPAFMGPPMFSTALFFHQVHLTETKDWILAAFVALIPVSTVVAVISILTTGNLLNRVGKPLFDAVLSTALRCRVHYFRIDRSVAVGCSRICLSRLGAGDDWRAKRYFLAGILRHRPFGVRSRCRGVSDGLWVGHWARDHRLFH